MRIIWSFNPADPVDGTPAFHGFDNKGTKSLQLIAEVKPKNKKEFLKDASPFDFLNSNVIT